MSNLAKAYNKLIKPRPSFYNPKSAPNMSPSALGSPCYRKVYYDFSKAPKENKIPIKLARLWRLGDVIGDHLIETFRKDKDIQVIDYNLPNGKPQMSFGKVRKEFPVDEPKLALRSGFLDMVFIEENKLKMAEFKSINENGYEKLNAGPAYKNVVQTVIYLFVFNIKLKKGDYKHIKALDGFTRLEEAHLLYYEKNSSKVKSFRLENLVDTFKQIVSKIIIIKSVLETKILPAPTQDYCKSCDYAKRCFKNALAPREGGYI